MILKTIQEAKNRGKKIEKAKFAFTNYEKALSALKFALRGGEFDSSENSWLRWKLWMGL